MLRNYTNITVTQFLLIEQIHGWTEQIHIQRSAWLFFFLYFIFFCLISALSSHSRIYISFQSSMWWYYIVQKLCIWVNECICLKYVSELHLFVFLFLYQMNERSTWKDQREYKQNAIGGFFFLLFFFISFSLSLCLHAFVSACRFISNENQRHRRRRRRRRTTTITMKNCRNTDKIPFASQLSSISVD